MAIKRIQLRGISRTPSDRMTEDGGVAESLNVSIDNDEIAPVLMPEDITASLGLPDGLQADRIFVHKTADYENYIIVSRKDDAVIINFTNRDQYGVITTLEKGEQIVGVTSVGNTLILTTSSQILYMLYVNNEYKYLGGSVPTPHIEFQSISNYGTKGVVNQYALLQTDDMSAIHNPINLFDVDVWNKAIEDRKDGNSTEYTTRLQQIEEELWAAIKQEVDRFRDKDRFASPLFARFAVRLYDGSYINHSVPILLGSGFDEFMTISGNKIESSSTIYTYIGYKLENIFDVTAYLKKWDTDGWEDIIESVDIFVSTNVYFPYLNSRFKKITLASSIEDEITSYTYAIEFEYKKDNSTALEDELLSKGVFYKIGFFPLNDDRLRKGWKLIEAENLKSETDLVLTEERLDDPLVNNEVIPGSLLNYNNRLLSTSGTVLAARGYSFLNATNIALGNDHKFDSTSYIMRFHIKGAKETIAISKYYDGSDEIETYEMKTSDEGGSDSSTAVMYGFLSHPDPNCYKVEIWTGSGDVYSIPMKAHPRLNCSYAFWGLSNPLNETLYAGTDVDKDSFVGKEDRVKSREWKVYAYDVNNPFIINQALTFQSKVLGIAVATTALSQGQFGQFPLYAFTEDGIWAIETAVDGSFVTNKPLSRDVCVNPDSITSIDNAVVFVTDKGAMLLQGSQVANISPNMNGRHYTVENTAKTIIERQEFFDGFIPVLSDSTHFLAFVKKAAIAYDYAGKTLIFINKNEKYQYIYKLDTHTWHKTAYDIDLVQPINSYPECYIQANNSYAILYVENAFELDDTTYPEFRNQVKIHLPNLTENQIRGLFEGENILVNNYDSSVLDSLLKSLSEHDADLAYDEFNSTRIYALSTNLDTAEARTPMRGVIATRPFDLGEPDVFKTITDVRIRGQFPKGAVKFILLGSNDGFNFYVINTLRGKSWKMFRIIILADLDPTDRISWIDVQYETKFTNRLR